MANLEITPRVVEALNNLYDPNVTTGKKELTRWLETFQKKPEAWSVADYLLIQKDSNLQAQLFAAQTLKAKITYDLHDLNLEARFQLRDSIVALLVESNTVSRSIRVQLCLALADLAIQLSEWKTVIPDVIEKLGQSPERIECLLEFLKILPEEMQSNQRLPMNETEYKSRGKELVDDNAEQVLNLLSVFMQSSGENSALQEQIFSCLHSWIYTGSLDLRAVVGSPLYQLAFQALNSEELFDIAVDIVVEIIRETSDVECYRDVIEQIYSLFGPMLSKLRDGINADDDDVVKGYCTLFVEAGNAYMTLIAKHPEAFVVLLDGICESVAYHDLDVADRTFVFWYNLTEILESDTYSSAKPSFTVYFDRLADILLKHLQYPPDDEEMTSQERDEFREFRHHMGDTLKDCCRILTPQRCLIKPLNILTQLLSDPSSTWQQIEAPVFSLRSMGAEVPEDENEVMPMIMDMLSKLPDHPTIRYAATLVISRYSFWTKYHPQYITYQLNFISSGFGNKEVAAASALALKHLCKDCSEQLVDFVSQLHMFYMNVGTTLSFRDRVEVTEAICHVVAVLPAASIKEALQSFCLPVAQELHTLVSKGKKDTRPRDYVYIGDVADQIGTFFKLIKPDIPVGQPHPCVEFIIEIMPVLDLAMANFGDIETICEPTCKCFAEMISSYGNHLLPIVTSIMERMVNGFEATGSGAYVWVASKVVTAFVKEQEMTGLCWELIKKMSELLFIKMQTTSINKLAIALSDYFILIKNVVKEAPSLLLHDAVFLSTVFRAGLACLGVRDTYCMVVLLEVYRNLLKLEVGRELVLNLFKEFGNELISPLIINSIEIYSYQVVDEVTELLRDLPESLPNESLQWIASAIDQVPEEYSSVDKKNEFLNAWALAVNEQQYSRLRRHFSQYLSSCKRSDKAGRLYLQ